MDQPAVIQTFLDKVEWEGLDYTAVYYSDWKEIKDVDLTLYEYIQAYKKVVIRLESYLDKIQE